MDDPEERLPDHPASVKQGAYVFEGGRWRRVPAGVAEAPTGPVPPEPARLPTPAGPRANISAPPTS